MSRVLRAALLCSVVALPQPAIAQSSDPAFGGDFTFRKIGPPPKGTKKKITIQIRPSDQKPAKPVPVRQPQPDAPETGVLEADGQMAWFWNVISPSMETPVRGRFSEAVAHVANAPEADGLPPPRLDDLGKIAASHGTDILIETLGKRISPALVLAVIAVESGGRVSVESHKGARGLMQLIPETAERFGVQDSSDPVQNIKGGVTYLEWLLEEFDGDILLALAGYNAGEGAVRKYGGVPPYDETRAYIPKILAAWRVSRTLCKTPPELFSDGCVFHTG
ncbi:MAG: lytic transglycosylase domain-containing protein [Litoreibacter sp.]|nr:lytic transglycosylase domain-containing protein [Litoreibacter sp.]